jgi:hypothetical protein
MSTSGQSEVEENGYCLDTVEEDIVWDKLVNDSKQGNVFSSSAFLSVLDANLCRYQVKNRQGDSLAQAAIIEENGAMHRAPFPFTPHQGILFSQKINSMPSHRQVAKKVEITEFLIKQLISRYGNFHMSLSPAFDDLRPFSWHNFHKADAAKFAITPRYTARLDLRGFELDTYLSSIRSVRRQEYQKSAAVVSESNDIDTFVDIYMKNFERQEITLDNLTLQRIKRIVLASISGGFGRLCEARVDGQPASMTLFVHDGRCAWYLFGANDPAWRKSGASTVLMIDNIRHYAEKGVPCVDFVGINSPQRGDYKLSFNGQLTPYFQVHLEP